MAYGWLYFTMRNLPDLEIPYKYLVAELNKIFNISTINLVLKHADWTCNKNSYNYYGQSKHVLFQPNKKQTSKIATIVMLSIFYTLGSHLILNKQWNNLHLIKILTQQ